MVKLSKNVLQLKFRKSQTNQVATYSFLFVFCIYSLAYIHMGDILVSDHSMEAVKWKDGLRLNLVAPIRPIRVDRLLLCALSSINGSKEHFSGYIFRKQVGEGGKCEGMQKLCDTNFQVEVER